MTDVATFLPSSILAATSCSDDYLLLNPIVKYIPEMLGITSCLCILSGADQSP